MLSDLTRGDVFYGQLAFAGIYLVSIALVGSIYDQIEGVRPLFGYMLVNHLSGTKVANLRPWHV